MSNALPLTRKAFTIAVVAATILWAVGLASIVPLTVKAASAGDLIKGSRAAVYYYGADGKRYVFPNQATYNTWYSDFSSVRVITDAELEAIAIGGNVTYRATSGSMVAVKIDSARTVYVVTNGGELRAIPDEATAASLLGANWNTKIHDVADVFFTNYRVGSPVAAGAALSSLAAAVANIGADKNIGSAGTPPLVAGVLTASLAAETPASASAPFSSGNVIFAKVKLMGTGSITQVKVTRSGLSANADVSNIKLFNGTTQVGTNQTLDAANQATFRLTTPWAVAGEGTLTIAADVAAAGTATAGNVIVLGINAASDVTLASGTVGGTFPIRGNGMSIASTTIGSLTVTNGSGNPTSDSTVDAGNTAQVVLLEARMTAGAVEDVAVTGLTAVKGGTSAITDVSGVQLYSVNSGTVIATVTGWNADSRAFFDLSAAPLIIKKGESLNLQVRIPAMGVVAGTGRTLSAYLEKSGVNVVGIAAYGKTYNIGLVAATVAGGWAGTATAQTINAGSLTFVKSASTPATGNVAPGAQAEKLASWDLIVRGEAIRATSQTVSFTLAGGMVIGSLTSCTLRDSAGAVVAGPVDPTGTTAVFTTTVTYPVGTNTYHLHCNIASTVAANQTVSAGITPSTQTTSTGVTSGNSVTGAPASAVAGNTLTVQAGALTVINRTTPPARNVVPGAMAVPLAETGFAATSSGEDIRITTVTYLDALTGAGANIADWANLRLTDENGVVLAGPEQAPTGVADAAATGTVLFTFDTPLVVTKRATKVVKLWGDLKSGIGVAAETHTWRVNAAASVAAAGVTTGTTITPTMSPTAGTGGQIMTLPTGLTGSLTSSLDASAPVSGIVVMGKTGVLVSAIKLVGASETSNLRTVTLTLGGSAATADVNNVALYSGDTKLADGIFNAATPPTVTFDLQSLSPKFSVDHLQTKVLSVKADFRTEPNGATSGNTIAFTLLATTDLVANGGSSGATINASAVVTGNTLALRKTKLTVTKNVINTTNLTVGTNDLYLDLTADASADVVFAAQAVNNDTIGAGEAGFNFTLTETGTGSGTAHTIIRQDNNQTISAVSSAIEAATNLAFPIDTALTVPAGTTRTIIVRVDLSGYSTTGNAVQLSLAADSTTAVQTTSSVLWGDDSTAGSIYDAFGLNLPLTHNFQKN